MAHPPALAGDMAMLRREAKQALRLAGFAIGGQVEATEVRSHDLLG